MQGMIQSLLLISIMVKDADCLRKICYLWLEPFGPSTAILAKTEGLSSVQYQAISRTIVSASGSFKVTSKPAQSICAAVSWHVCKPGCSMSWSFSCWQSLTPWNRGMGVQHKKLFSLLQR